MPLFEHGFLGEEADQARQQILHKYADLFARSKSLTTFATSTYARRSTVTGKILTSPQLAISCED
jgi:hypothetical protein